MQAYPGRMFSHREDPEGDAFFDYGIGAMQWGKDSEGRRVLWFLAPSVEEDSDGPELARIYTMNDGKNWSHPGNVVGWDGNEDRPTFNPSIWLRDRQGWHGWIKNRNLVTA